MDKAKHVYLTRQLGNAFGDLLYDQAKGMTKSQLIIELDHARSLNGTNCGWTEFEVRDILMKELIYIIKVIELDEAKEAERAAE